MGSASTEVSDKVKALTLFPLERQREGSEPEDCKAGSGVGDMGDILSTGQKTPNENKTKLSFLKKATELLNIKKYRPHFHSQIWEYKVKATSPQNVSDLVSRRMTLFTLFCDFL